MEENIKIIITKALENIATPEEKAMLENWRAKSAGNENYYQETRSIWENASKAKNLNPSLDVNIDYALKSVHRKLPKENLWIRPLMKYAAVGALLILAATFFLRDQAELIQVVTLDGERKELTLPDNSVVWLNENSQLSYLSKFSEDTRDIELQGEAFFDVERDESKPFVIKTLHAGIRVLGTSFNIDTRGDQTEVSVTTGKVQVNLNDMDKSVVLTPNQSAVATTDALINGTVENENYIAWKTGSFEFEKSSITEVVKELNTYYDDEIVLSNSSSDCLLTSSFKQLGLLEILEIVKLSCSLDVKHQNGRYEIY